MKFSKSIVKKLLILVLCTIFVLPTIFSGGMSIVSAEGDAEPVEEENQFDEEDELVVQTLEDTTSLKITFQNNANGHAEYKNSTDESWTTVSEDMASAVTMSSSFAIKIVPDSGYEVDHTALKYIINSNDFVDIGDDSILAALISDTGLAISVTDAEDFAGIKLSADDVFNLDGVEFRTAPPSDDGESGEPSDPENQGGQYSDFSGISWNELNGNSDKVTAYCTIGDGTEESFDTHKNLTAGQKVKVRFVLANGYEINPDTLWIRYDNQDYFRPFTKEQKTSVITALTSSTGYEFTYDPMSIKDSDGNSVLAGRTVSLSIQIAVVKSFAQNITLNFYGTKEAGRTAEDKIIYGRKNNGVYEEDVQSLDLSYTINTNPHDIQGIGDYTINNPNNIAISYKSSIPGDNCGNFVTTSVGSYNSFEVGGYTTGAVDNVLILDDKLLDEVYVDSNGDKKFEDSEKVTPTAAGKYTINLSPKASYDIFFKKHDSGESTILWQYTNPSNEDSYVAHGKAYVEKVERKNDAGNWVEIAGGMSIDNEGKVTYSHMPADDSGVRFGMDDDGSGTLWALNGDRLTIKLVPTYGYQLKTAVLNERPLEPQAEVSTFTFILYGNLHFSGIFEKVEDTIANSSAKLGTTKISNGDNATDTGSLKLSIADKANPNTNEFLAKANEGGGNLTADNVYAVVDMSLQNLVSKGTEGQNWVSDINSFEDNINISMNVSGANLANNETLVVVREHEENGNTTRDVIETEFDSNGNLVVPTNKFSTYAIIKKSVDASTASDFTIRATTDISENEDEPTFSPNSLNSFNDGFDGENKITDLSIPFGNETIIGVKLQNYRGAAVAISNIKFVASSDNPVNASLYEVAEWENIKYYRLNAGQNILKCGTYSFEYIDGTNNYGKINIHVNYEHVAAFKANTFSEENFITTCFEDRLNANKEVFLKVEDDWSITNTKAIFWDEEGEHTYNDNEAFTYDASSKKISIKFADQSVVDDFDILIEAQKDGDTFTLNLHCSRGDGDYSFDIMTWERDYWAYCDNIDISTIRYKKNGQTIEKIGTGFSIVDRYVPNYGEDKITYYGKDDVYLFKAIVEWDEQAGEDVIIGWEFFPMTDSVAVATNEADRSGKPGITFFLSDNGIYGLVKASDTELNSGNRVIKENAKICMINAWANDADLDFVKNNNPLGDDNQPELGDTIKVERVPHSQDGNLDDSIEVDLANLEYTVSRWDFEQDKYVTVSSPADNQYVSFNRSNSTFTINTSHGFMVSVTAIVKETETGFYWPITREFYANQSDINEIEIQKLENNVFVSVGGNEYAIEYSAAGDKIKICPSERVESYSIFVLAGMMGYGVDGAQADIFFNDNNETGDITYIYPRYNSNGVFDSTATIDVNDIYVSEHFANASTFTGDTILTTTGKAHGESRIYVRYKLSGDNVYQIKEFEWNHSNPNDSENLRQDYYAGEKVTNQGYRATLVNAFEYKMQTIDWWDSTRPIITAYDDSMLGVINKLVDYVNQGKTGVVSGAEYYIMIESDFVVGSGTYATAHEEQYVSTAKANSNTNIKGVLFVSSGVEYTQSFGDYGVLAVCNAININNPDDVIFYINPYYELVTAHDESKDALYNAVAVANASAITAAEKDDLQAYLRHLGSEGNSLILLNGSPKTINGTGDGLSLSDLTIYKTHTQDDGKIVSTINGKTYETLSWFALPDSFPVMHIDATTEVSLYGLFDTTTGDKPNVYIKQAQGTNCFINNEVYTSSTIESMTKGSVILKPGTIRHWKLDEESYLYKALIDRLETDVDTSNLGVGNVKAATASVDSKELAKQLIDGTNAGTSMTADERAVYDAGSTAVVNIGIEDLAEANASTDFKTELAKLTKDSSVDYIDINLNYQIGYDATSETAITETSEPVVFTVDIVDANYVSGKTYTVYRYHDDAVAAITPSVVAYNSSTKAVTLRFATDKFSEYAICENELPVVAPSNSGSASDTSSASAASTSTVKKEETKKEETKPTTKTATKTATKTETKPESTTTEEKKAPVVEKTVEVKANDEKAWKEVSTEISTAIEEAAKIEEGGKAEVVLKLSDASAIPGEVFDNIKGKDVDVVFEISDKVSWIINGNDITGDGIGEINLNVRIGEDAVVLPQEVMSQVVSSEEQTVVPLSLDFDGEFGFKATLEIKIDKEAVGQYANLFFFNPDTNELEFMCSGLIDENGNSQLDFVHASDYVIVVDKVSMAPSDVETTSEDGEDVIASDIPVEEENAKEGGFNPLWILAIIAVLVVFGIVVWTVTKKKE